MAYQVDTADNFYDFVGRMIRFLKGFGTITGLAYVGTGDGEMTDLRTADPDAPAETWTVTCTATAVDGGTFSVTGSVSGAQASATVGVPYDNGIVAFTIEDGATDFDIGDEFVFSTLADGLPSAQRWEFLRERRDNLAGILSNMSPSTSGLGRDLFHSCRYDSRTLHRDSLTASNTGRTSGSSLQSGVSFVHWELREARDIARVHLSRSHYTNAAANNAMPAEWRLQWSDDGSVWTTAYTANDYVTWSPGEARLYEVTSAPGAHIHWRVLFDAVISGSSWNWWELMLLEDDGTVANHYGDELIMRAPGSGSDEIYMGIRSEYDAGAGWYNLFLNGYTGFSSGASWHDQPGAFEAKDISGTSRRWYTPPMVPLWDGPTPYWFIANGRRFALGAKVSSNYETGYMGFMLPYATPAQYPYPLVIAGSLVSSSSSSSTENRTTAFRYSETGGGHGSVAGPGNNTTATDASKFTGTMFVRDVNGEWFCIGNRQGDSGISDIGPSCDRGVWPFAAFGNSGGRFPFRPCVGGGLLLTPCVLHQLAPVPRVYGELEGVFHAPGFSVGAEDTTVKDGVTHVILQSAHRNSINEFFALALE